MDLPRTGRELVPAWLVCLTTPSCTAFPISASCAAPRTEELVSRAVAARLRGARHHRRMLACGTCARTRGKSCAAEAHRRQQNPVRRRPKLAGSARTAGLWRALGADHAGPGARRKAPTRFPGKTWQRIARGVVGSCLSGSELDYFWVKKTSRCSWLAVELHHGANDFGKLKQLQGVSETHWPAARRRGATCTCTCLRRACRCAHRDPPRQDGRQLRPDTCIRMANDTCACALAWRNSIMLIYWRNRQYRGSLPPFRWTP